MACTPLTRDTLLSRSSLSKFRRKRQRAAAGATIQILLTGQLIMPGEIWEFPKIRGTLFWGPYNKDPTL